MTTQNPNGRTPRDPYARDEHGRGARGRWSRRTTHEDQPRDEPYGESSGRFPSGADDEAYRGSSGRRARTDEERTSTGRVAARARSRDEREGHWIDRPDRDERGAVDRSAREPDRERERDREASVEYTGYRRELRPLGAMRPGPHRGKGPLGYQRSDERIHELVCEALADDDQVDATQIEVTVSDGIVTLSGAVPDRPTKRMAEDCVDRVAGVRDVHNQLEIVLGARGNRAGGGAVGGNEL